MHVLFLREPPLVKPVEYFPKQFFDSRKGLMSFKQLDVAGDIPSPRSWHGTALSSNQQNIIIHGGYDGNIALNDIHIFQIRMLFQLFYTQ